MTDVPQQIEPQPTPFSWRIGGAQVPTEEGVTALTVLDLFLVTGGPTRLFIQRDDAVALGKALLAHATGGLQVATEMPEAMWNDERL